VREIKNLTTHLLEYATKQGADLHICPKSAPFVRLGGKNGELEQVPGFDDWQLDLATVKAFIGELLTPEQKGELQKNKFLDFTLAHGELGRFRAFAYTQRGTHAITIHTLPFNVPDFYKLELPNEVNHAIERIVMEDKGLFIVAGDYYSEKSKTLAAIVDLINRKRVCYISTIENPIEYLHRHKKSVVVQKEIGADVPDFAAALQQIRHENPDVVALSELQRGDFLSVMELAEERLVIASVKTNQPPSDGAIGVMRAVRLIADDEAERKNLIDPFIPKPRISIIFQQSFDAVIYGELLTWEMYAEAMDNKEFLLKPITFGRGADNGAGDGRADT
jgi:Tfp pilus assembly pilus retraction ATPase PilT